MRTGKRVLCAVAAAGSALVLTAGTSFAHECINASKKNMASGAQLVINTQTGEIVWATNGIWNRINQGLIDPKRARVSTA